MARKNSDIKSRIYGRISASTPGAVWVAGDFVDFGPRDTVSKALQRLEAMGRLRRVGPGLYDRPRFNRLTEKATVPDYRAVIDAIARRDQARMLIDGMTAANDLGLSDAVPGRVVIHSDARLSPLRLGNLTITFRRTAASRLYWAGKPAMRVVQALHWLMPKLSNPEDAERIRRRIQEILAGPQGREVQEDLLAGLRHLPTWMQSFLREIMPTPGGASQDPLRAPKK